MEGVSSQLRALCSPSSSLLLLLLPLSLPSSLLLPLLPYSAEASSCSVDVALLAGSSGSGLSGPSTVPSSSAWAGITSARVGRSDQDPNSSSNRSRADALGGHGTVGSGILSGSEVKGSACAHGVSESSAVGIAGGSGALLM